MRGFFDYTVMKYYWIFLLIIFAGCKPAPDHVKTNNTEVAAPLTLLDSTAAARVIAKDDQEYFFEKVGISDMLIQMKRPYRDSINRDTLLSEYRTFLKTEVLNFSKEETDFCQDIFNEIHPQLLAIHPDIYPDNLQLIKLKGNHYGPGAFYTRERAILIPQGVLKEKQRASFYETMLHEIFHIYSRYHPEKRRALYALIGFKKLNDSDILSLDASLKNRLLLNPDGIDMGYAIALTEANTSFSAVPVLAANEMGFVSEKPVFFDYLNFNLYPIQPSHNDTIKVLSQTDGSSRLDLNEVKGFYEQIQKNTDYIIHPDEILADNFIFMVQARQDARTLEQFSEEGIRLIEEMEKVIRR